MLNILMTTSFKWKDHRKLLSSSNTRLVTLLDSGPHILGAPTKTFFGCYTSKLYVSYCTNTWSEVTKNEYVVYRQRLMVFNRWEGVPRGKRFNFMIFTASIDVIFLRLGIYTVRITPCTENLVDRYKTD